MQDSEAPSPPAGHCLGSSTGISAGIQRGRKYGIPPEEREAWRRRLQAAVAAGTTTNNAWKSLNNALLCRRDVLVLRDAQGELGFLPYRCGKKYCPACLDDWSASLGKRALNAVAGMKPAELRHLVLTVPNAPAEELKTAANQLGRAFREWKNEGRRTRKHGRPWWKVDGHTWKLELHWNGKTGWHPHLHVLVHAPAGLPLRKGDAGREAWHSITERYGPAASFRDGVFITKPTNEAAVAREVTKYAAKPLPLRGTPPARLAEMAEALHKTRFHGSSGTLSLGSEKAPAEGQWTFLGLAGPLLARHLLGNTRDGDRDIELGADIAESLAAAYPTATERQSYNWGAIIDPLAAGGTTP
jgi:hypothetical protein